MKSHPKDACAPAHPPSAETAASSSTHVSGHASHDTGHESLISVPPKLKSHPKDATAPAHPPSAETAPSSSEQEPASHTLASPSTATVASGDPASSPSGGTLDKTKSLRSAAVHVVPDNNGPSPADKAVPLNENAKTTPALAFTVNPAPSSP